MTAEAPRRDELGPRWLPLLGVAFVGLLVVALFLVGGGAPEAGAEGAEVVTYYEDNASRELLGSILALVAAATLVFFAAHVRRLVAAREGPLGLFAAVIFGSALILAAAIGVAEGIHGALSIEPDSLTPGAAEALNTLEKQFFFPTMLGFGLLMLSLGLAIVRLRLLPGALGWISLALGVVLFTPAAYVAILLSFVVLLAISVLLYARG
jgi:hypothetical protein